MVPLVAGDAVVVHGSSVRLLRHASAAVMAARERAAPLRRLWLVHGRRGDNSRAVEVCSGRHLSSLAPRGAVSRILLAPRRDRHGGGTCRRRASRQGAVFCPCQRPVIGPIFALGRTGAEDDRHHFRVLGAGTASRPKAMSALGAGTQMQALLLDSWLACLATALGALPAHALQAAVGDARRAAVIALGGCVAAGMMIGASALLVLDARADASTLFDLVAFAAGACASVCVVRAIAWATTPDADSSAVAAKRAERGGGAAAVRSALLLVALATDALAEGVAMGVAAHRDEMSADGATRRSLPLMALMLAVHNIPEGMAAASAWHASRAEGGQLQRVASGTELLRSALLAMATSLPQPVGAVLAFHFLRAAAGALPVMQGVAAGSLAFVAAAELLPHATPTVGSKAAYGTALASALGAAALHELTG